MVEAMVLLDSVDKVKDFVEITRRAPYECDLTAGRYKVDGKSIMGVLSLDLSKPVLLTLHDGDTITEQDALEDYEEYIL